MVKTRGGHLLEQNGENLSERQSRILLVRHGETLWKKQGITQGQKDSNLTSAGINQSIQISKKLKNKNIKLIISSSLGRCKETTKIIGNEINMENIKFFSEFNERNEGVLEGLTKKQQIQKYPYLFDRNKNLLNIEKIPEGESLKEFYNRIKKGLKIINQYINDHNILIVTHTGVILCILSIFLNLSYLEVEKKYKIHYCELIALDKTSKINSV